jgi:ABC-type Fe3+ transport system permease subunit
MGIIALAFHFVPEYNISMVFLIILGVAILAGVIFLAISKKSTFKIRVAALGALALMVVSVIVCMVVYFKGEKSPKMRILPDTLPSDIPPPQSETNVAMLVMLFLFMIALFGAVLVVSLREHKRSEGKKVEEPEEEAW